MDTADAVAAKFEELRASMRKTGKVTAIVGVKVVVSILGSSMTLPKLRDYTPIVGDVVIIDATDPNAWLVIGSPG
ncbi:hypothetical protein [Amycolatopsis sp. NPDC059657]|uniref:hypothetical protein n=1 Tax=Amycolatopsis sp. NPDC059657 TaxID=3346899 RepID=UPI003672BF5C